MTIMTQLCFEDVQVGMEIPALKKHPSPEQLVKWAGASGDFNVIHYNKEAALAQGLPDIIVHGRLKSAFLSQLVTDWIGAQGALKKIAVQHRATDTVNTDMVCKGVVKNKSAQGGENLVTLEVWTENSRGEKTCRGDAVVALPSRGH